MMKTRLKKKLFTDVVHLCPPGEPYKYLLCKQQQSS